MATTRSTYRPRRFAYPCPGCDQGEPFVWLVMVEPGLIEMASGDDTCPRCGAGRPAPEALWQWAVERDREALEEAAERKAELSSTS